MGHHLGVFSDPSRNPEAHGQVTPSPLAWRGSPTLPFGEALSPHPSTLSLSRGGGGRLHRWQREAQRHRRWAQQFLESWVGEPVGSEAPLEMLPLPVAHSSGSPQVSI